MDRHGIVGTEPTRQPDAPCACLSLPGLDPLRSEREDDQQADQGEVAEQDQIVQETVDLGQGDTVEGHTGKEKHRRHEGVVDEGANPGNHHVAGKSIAYGKGGSGA
jgi:hypothetical protein